MGNLATKTTLPPLVTVPWCETARFMGTWFVIGVKPTVFETTCSNAVERYTLLDDDGSKGHDVGIDFEYNGAEPILSPLKSLPQKGWVRGEDRAESSEWRVSPLFPLKLPFPIIELDEKNYDYCVVGYPSRSYCWIMSRKPRMKESTYEMLCDRLKEKHRYDLDGLRRVPQVWTEEEREKRSLTKEIPDSFLTRAEDLN